ncbi:MAG: hypothetical protein ACLQDV_27080 [Candidatus Binataceae bacterium]
MNRLVYVFGTLGIVAMMSVPALAQDASPSVTGVVQRGDTTIVFERSNADLNLDQLDAFGQVTASDPAMASKLARNPSLVNDEGFVGKHPALQQYLEKYPNAREDIAANPGNYLTPVSGSAWSHAAPGLKE